MNAYDKPHYANLYYWWIETKWKEQFQFYLSIFLESNYNTDSGSETINQLKTLAYLINVYNIMFLIN